LAFELKDLPLAAELGVVAGFPRFVTTGGLSSSSEDIGIASAGLCLFSILSVDVGGFFRLDGPAAMFDVDCIKGSGHYICEISS
jgi:hypothetical protein